MWQVEPTDQWDKDRKWYEKKRPSELAAILTNLDRYLRQLNVAANAKCVQAGFLHVEPAGVLAIDQKGGGGNLQETRMYVYANQASNVLYLITIGNKSEQHSDIEFCKNFVANLREPHTD